jgi:hypothetical protein
MRWLVPRLPSFRAECPHGRLREAAGLDDGGKGVKLGQGR